MWFFNPSAKGKIREVQQGDIIIIDIFESSLLLSFPFLVGYMLSVRYVTRCLHLIIVIAYKEPSQLSLWSWEKFRRCLEFSGLNLTTLVHVFMIICIQWYNLFYAYFYSCILDTNSQVKEEREEINTAFSCRFTIGLAFCRGLNGKEGFNRTIVKNWQ